MRGKGSIESIIERRIRITPAYAGKSRKLEYFSVCIWDHPRLCGEKSDMLEKITWNLGSPPPMRGKVVNKGVILDDTRITPAYAGKSRVFTSPDGGKKDHPRLCGEKSGEQTPETMYQRITPAYAGKRR